jgi:hypothetical protein
MRKIFVPYSFHGGNLYSIDSKGLFGVSVDLKRDIVAPLILKGLIFVPFLVLLYQVYGNGGRKMPQRVRNNAFRM